MRARGNFGTHHPTPPHPTVLTLTLIGCNSPPAPNYTSAFCFHHLSASASACVFLLDKERERERGARQGKAISSSAVMDPDAFTASLFKWDPRGAVAPPNRLLEAVAPPPPPPGAGTTAASVAAAYAIRPRELGGLEDLFQEYGVRYYTAAKIAELGFTVSTLLDMKDDELDDMMNSLCQIFRWDLLVGERYGIKAAVRAERRRLDDEDSRRRHLLSADTANAIDALSQEGVSCCVFLLSIQPSHSCLKLFLNVMSNHQ